MRRSRGRPREYDPDEALEAAMNVFWEHGYAATSLSDLSEATGMNRPSLYAAFGDKRAIYLQTLQRFGERLVEQLDRVLAAKDFEQALTDFYFRTIELHLSGESEQRGCMMVSTAGLVAVSDAEVRTLLRQSIDQLDTKLTEGFVRALDEGRLPAEAARRGRLATAVLHSLSVRARAGQSRRALRKFARESVALLVQL